ncbi:MAG: 2-oxoacid:ferredoxin oxidoreductase subunit beta [Chloroflexi bacterium]|nr:2-oxoacid:ferredoxin oxidoreductase subunit beta [Chloroflexota bacterium]
MTTKNSNYDFKWCPGCGDFGVRRAIEFALGGRNEKHETRMQDNVIVAGIGCSGNLVHLLESDEQPFGIHGIHGRTLPIALGVKSGSPNSNVIIVAGDGDFLSIGMEHIGPQAQRNLDVTAVIMDNGVYGLTKGQGSPTTKFGTVTSSTPFGKIEAALNPLSFYLEIGVSFIASHYSSKPRELAALIETAMEHKGFSIVHVQSPCTTYNDTYEQLKGNKRKGIDPGIIDLPEGYDPSDRAQAMAIIADGRVPLGVIYKEDRPTLNDQYVSLTGRAPATSSPDKILASYAI